MTREQIEKARHHAERMAEALEQGRLTSLTPGIDSDALRTLLAETADPDDNVLRVEARAFLEKHGPLGDRDIYVAGANREGRKL